MRACIPSFALRSLTYLLPGRRHTSLAGTPTQIRLDSPIPPPNSSASSGPGHQRSRLSRQVAQEPDEDEDAEGEEDEEEDQTLYCLCRMKSHGDVSVVSFLQLALLPCFETYLPPSLSHCLLLSTPFFSSLSRGHADRSFRPTDDWLRQRRVPVPVVPPFMRQPQAAAA